MLFNILIGLALLIIGYFIMPKPKAPKPDEVQQLEAPTASAGKQAPVIFGDKLYKEANFNWYGNIQNVRKKKKSKKK
jgi:hypothetical protein